MWYAVVAVVIVLVVLVIVSKAKAGKRRESELLSAALERAVAHIDQQTQLRKYAWLVLGVDVGQGEQEVSRFKSALGGGKIRIADAVLLQLIDHLERAGCVRTDRPRSRRAAGDLMSGLPPSAEGELALSSKVSVTPLGKTLYTFIAAVGAGRAGELGLSPTIVRIVQQWDKELMAEASKGT